MVDVYSRRIPSAHVLGSSLEDGSERPDTQEDAQSCTMEMPNSIHESNAPMS